MTVPPPPFPARRPALCAVHGVLLGAALGLAGCSSTDPLPRPADLATTPMRQDQDRPGAWIYKAANTDFRRYNRFIIEPVQVYRGSGSSYGGLSDAQVQELAQLFASEARRALNAGGYTVTTQPGPGTLRIVPKLVRVEETVGGVATVSRILPIGAIVNLAEGPEQSGTFTGSVITAVEAFDSQSSTLLAATVRRHSPATFDLEATLSTMDTARASVREAAQELKAAVDRAHGRAPR